MATINVRIDDEASRDDMRDAWQYALDDTLKRQIRDALWFECIKRGIEPREIVFNPPPTTS